MPQGKVHFPVCEWNFVTKGTWPGCWSISLSLPACSSPVLSSLTACNEQGSNEEHFPWEGTFLHFCMTQSFPTHSLPAPLMEKWNSSGHSQISNIPNFQTAAGAPAGLLHSGSVPCSTVYFGCVIGWGYEFQHRSELWGDIRKKGWWDSLVLPALKKSLSSEPCR